MKIDIFTLKRQDPRHKINLMQRIICSVIFLSFFLGTVCTSCNSGKKLCQEKSFHKTYNTKKNRSKYNQRYSIKPKSVKKDYRIRNGIAN